jgi:hypothetical protein
LRIRECRDVPPAKGLELPLLLKSALVASGGHEPVARQGDVRTTRIVFAR